MKKINVYVNGEYLFSTNKYKRCKDVLECVKSGNKIIVASIPKNKEYIYNGKDSIKAYFER